jgi:hypothetical protein
VPVSHKRKKTRKSSRKPKQQTYSPPGGPGIPQQERAAGFAGFAEYRRQLDQHRASLAAAAAEPMIVELIGLAAARTDAELEDELCTRIGRALTDLDNAPIDDHVGPTTFAEAMIDAAVDAATTAMGGETGDLAQAWRLLTAVAGIVNHPLGERVAEAIADLRTRPGGDVLPESPAGPAPFGPVLWTRDAYGSRFGVTAAFRTAGGRERWYLWDVDACGHEAFTVHSRYHATQEEALADWRAGVGTPAADGAVFAPVDDPGLLEFLLPRELGTLAPGGENVEQFAEYHRSRRLAEAVLDALEEAEPHPTSTPADLDPATAANLFRAWLTEHRPERPEPDDFDDLVTELADSWRVGELNHMYHACSPHRVALVVEHIRDFYQDDFAADLIALLPDWTAWLADRNATPAHLTDRCRPYVHGEPHRAISGDDRRPRYLARITE